MIAAGALLLAVITRASYRNGVRDGYANSWLPHVQKQIQEEDLKRG
jgi:hypothetical protein